MFKINDPVEIEASCHELQYDYSEGKLYDSIQFFSKSSCESHDLDKVFDMFNKTSTLKRTIYKDDGDFSHFNCEFIEQQVEDDALALDVRIHKNCLLLQVIFGEESGDFANKELLMTSRYSAPHNVLQSVANLLRLKPLCSLMLQTTPDSYIALMNLKVCSVNMEKF